MYLFQQNNTLHEFYLAFATLATYEYFAFGCGHCLSKHSYDTLRHKLYKLRIAPCCTLPQSYKYSLSRAAYASLRAHTCCLRNRIRSLTRASRAASPSAFSKSLYNKHSYDTLCHKLYKLRIAPCCALPQSYKYSLSRAAYASLRAHTCCLRNRIPVSYARFACDESFCVFEELIQ